MRKYILSLIVLLMCLFLIGCNKDLEESKGDFDFSGGISGDIFYKGSISDFDGVPSGDVPSENNQPQVTAGQLTSSVYFDNERYDYWKSLMTFNDKQENGIFKEYVDDSFNTLNRLKVTITGLANANVSVDDFSGVTDSNGVVYLFPEVKKEKYEITIKYQNSSSEEVILTKTITGDTIIDDLVGVEKNKRIELMFVIDATGSMGDEISYLKTEIIDVITKVKEDNDDVEVLLSLLFYRDAGDDYVTRYFDFTTDYQSQINNLSNQSASGGGDFEEAVYKAFEEAVSKQWSNNSTKILVHVADAPSHNDELVAWNQAIKTCASKGIRIITVASSGIDKKTEYLFRSQCLLTGGAYGYLTNDSGIGGDHIEATVEEKMVVEYLNDMLVRLINGYYTGTFSEAIAWNNQQE